MLGGRSGRALTVVARPGYEFESVERSTRDISKLRVHLTVSADGYVAGPNQSEENPLGEGGGSLHDWAFALRAFREPHGMEGGELNASNRVVEEAPANVGAEIMGRGKVRGRSRPVER
jgi:hypothetical protein